MEKGFIKYIVTTGVRELKEMFFIKVIQLKRNNK
jgi:hypothetical protein